MIKLIQINKKIFTSIYIANNINYKLILYFNNLDHNLNHRKYNISDLNKFYEKIIKKTK